MPRFAPGYTLGLRHIFAAQKCRINAERYRAIIIFKKESISIIINITIVLLQVD